MKFTKEQFTITYLGALILALLVFGFAIKPINDPTAIKIKTAEPTGVWRSCTLPVGLPAVGLWKSNGEIITTPCIKTDFAGVYEYTENSRSVLPLSEPDFWMALPTNNP